MLERHLYYVWQSDDGEKQKLLLTPAEAAEYRREGYRVEEVGHV